MTPTIRAVLWIGGSSLLLPYLGGCVTIPKGLEPVTGFQADRYLGTWYEIARLDHWFERGLTDATATYEKRSDGGISVVNRGYDPSKNQWKEAKGKAYFVGDETVGRLKVSFFGPFYGGYNIIALDQEQYRWAVVCGNNRDYFWILAREKSLPPDLLQDLVGRARRWGFDTEALIYVKHDRQP